MPKKIQKSLQDYLSNIKNPNPHIQSSKTWLLSGCKHPKTPSFAVDRNQKDCSNENNGDKKNEAATLADIDRFLHENFKSLYIKNDEEEEAGEKDGHPQKRKGDHRHEAAHSPSGSNTSKNLLFEFPRFGDLPPPDLQGPQRFFVSLGTSGSLIEEAGRLSSSLTTTTTVSEDNIGSSSSTSTNNTLDDSVTFSNTINTKHDAVALPDDCVAVLKSSPCPYDDFRQSMQEMVEARIVQHKRRVDWDFMEELLLCYLNVNEKKSHKYVLSAFVDLVVALRRDSDKVPARSRRIDPRIARERRRKLVRNVT